MPFDIRVTLGNVPGYFYTQPRTIRQMQTPATHLRRLCRNAPLERALNLTDLKNLQIGQSGDRMSVGHRHQPVVPGVGTLLDAPLLERDASA